MINQANTGVKSTLISGVAWDTTLQWMVKASDNKDNEPNLGYDEDSTGKGWYNDVSSGRITRTGQYSVNNIYDMGGNIYEYTTENCINNGNSNVVARGGDADDLGIDNPAAYRLHSFGNTDVGIGLRVLLYK